MPRYQIGLKCSEEIKYPFKDDNDFKLYIIPSVTVVLYNTMPCPPIANPCKLKDIHRDNNLQSSAITSIVVSRIYGYKYLALLRSSFQLRIVGQPLSMRP